MTAIEQPRVVDVRGPRVSAAITFVVLATAFLLSSTALLALQVGVFAIAAAAGLRWSPYAFVFRYLRRRLRWGPPPATEPESGPRFSQLCGLLFSGAGLIAVVGGATRLGWGLVLVVLTLSGLLASTGLCVGCEIHALGRRLRRRAGATARTTGA